MILKSLFISFFVVIILTQPLSVYSQSTPCTINLSYTVTSPANGVIDCNGAEIELQATGTGQEVGLISNDFNAGLGTGWIATGGSTVGTPCEPSLDNTSYYWASTAGSGTPNLTTVGFDVSCGGIITFDMDYATQGQSSPCEGPDLPNEGVSLEYSTDGGASWIVIDYWDPNGGYDPTLTSWNSYSYPIPIGAQTANTQFQWIQNNSSGSAYDNWGIDNVVINAYSCNTYWYNYTSTSAWVDNSNQIEAITATSTYGVWFTDGISDSCYAEVTVIVPPGPDANAGLNQTICNGSSIIIGADPVTSEDGATYTWDNGAGSGTIDIAGGTDNGQVTVSPVVTTTYELTVEANGCTETDQVVVTVDNPPTASNPAPIVVECASALPAPDINVVTDEADDYTVPPTVTYIGETVDVAGCPETRTRTYRVTDGCGNFVDVFQTITIDPTTNPVVPADGGSTVNCLADAQVQPAAPAVTDVCGNALTPVVTTPADIPCEGTMDWVFTYTDCSGNTADWTYTYTIDIPAFTLPFADAGSTVNCLVDAQVQPTPPAAVTDQCGNTLTPVVTTPADIPCEGTMDWVFTYTDCAGNTADWTYTYTIDIPAFTVPADGGSTVNCLADAQVQPAAPAVNDQCGNALTPVVTTPADILCEGTMDWVFTYTDCAGNTADWTYTYTIDIPAFTVPADGGSTVNCLADAQVQPAAPAVTDQCGNTLTPVVTTPADILCEGTMDWVFTYTDCAGNTADWTYTYTIDIPAFTVPADAGSTVNCLVDAQVQPTPPAAVTDQCGNTLTPVVTTPADIPCEGTMDWVFTYTDCAGNTADWTYTYTIDIPAFTLPFVDAGSTVNCLVDAQVQPTPPAAVTDQCGNTLTPVVTTPADIPCEGTMDWVFTYTDCAGNTADWTYTYTIDIPAFTVPADGGSTVNCLADAQVQPTPPAAVTDQCGNTLTPVVTTPADIPCEGTMDWVFTYTDCAGNTADWTYTYTIDIPAFTVPADGGSTVNCLADAQVQPAAPAVNDQCGNALTPVVTTPADIPCEGTMDWVFTYTDCAGNTADWTYTYTIDIPAFTVPADGGSTVNCLADAQVQPAAPAVNDQCGNALTPVVTTPADILCEGTMDWVFTYTDCAGNTADWTYTYTIDIPAFTVPADAGSTVNCLVDAQVQPTPPAAVTDQCGNTLTPVVTTPADIPCEGTMDWVFTYTDCAGNIADWTYTYTIDIPAFTLPFADAGSTVNCLVDAQVQPTPPAAVTDQCGNTLTPVVTTPADIPCEGTMDWVFTYTDCAGNTADWTYTYTIDIPAFTLPANGSESVVCIGDVYVPTPPVMNDGCGNPITPVMNENADPVCVGDKIYTFTYTDCAGNTADWTYTFSINDNVPPTGTAPADINLVLGDPIPPADPTLITDEDDNCAAVPTVVHVSDVSDGGACPEIITRTYEIEDACGNTTQVTQLIIIGDGVLPTASDPAPITVECLADVPAPDETVVIDEADNGPVPTVTWEDDTPVGTCPTIIDRRYRVTDNCGNFIFVTQTITVIPSTNPVISIVDGGSVVNCLADAQVQPVAPAVNDVCGNAITPVVTTPTDVVCEGDMTWIFTYTDCAGNSSLWNYTYTIDLPAFTLPPNDGQTVNCLADAVVPTPPVMTDLCGNAITPVMSENADPACEGDKIYTFTYTDCAGNTADWVYTYTIDIPAFTLPANGSESVVCIGDIYIPTPPVMTDECGNALTPVMSENADPICVGDKIYTFTYTDCAGNTADWTYTFSINDNVPPTGTAPADIYLNVGAPIPPADPTLITDEDDNCAAVPTVVHVSDVSDGGACPEIITRTYEIEDACGNTTQVTQLITIGDIVDPTASNPLPVNVECIFDVPAPDITVVTDEADNSGIAPIVAHVGDVSDGQTCPETITRTYSVTDVCGNQITVEQTITVNDVTAPTATAPATVNVECIGDIPPADVNIITDEADNCTAVPVVAHVGDVSDGLSCPETITRTYSITDDCGNVTTIDQLIIVNDITPPTATAPATVNVECIGDVPPADISDITDESDNCTVNPVVVHVGDVSDGLSCPETITRTYSITDDCGNSITVDQLIIVNDITPPTASNPAPISVPGAPLVPAPDPSVVIDELDNCTVTPIITWVSDVSDGNVCNMEVITRTYSVMDDCGNEIFVTQEITIEAVPPPIDAGPDTLICSDGMATLTADNPWGVPISWDNGITDGMPFSPNGNAVYTVIADNYGCTSTDDVTVTVEQIPTILFTGDQLSGCEPLTVTFTNSSLAESAFDNCLWEFSNGTALTGCSDVTYTFENGGLYDVTLTTTTVNGCVNSDTYTDYVYVEDIPLAGFIPNSTIISNLNPEINFVNTTADAALGTVYSWTFGDGSPIINSESPTHIFPNENSGSYEVEMIATSPLGCIDTAYGYVRVVEEVIFYVPNTFTPDADDFNEYFQPIFTSGYDPYDFNLFIFNRWGEIIWESHDASVGWDGTYGGNLVQDGTYTWTIEFKTSESDERMYVNGHVNIIK